MIKLLISLAVVVLLGAAIWVFQGPQEPQGSPAPTESATANPSALPTRTGSPVPTTTLPPVLIPSDEPTPSGTPKQHSVTIQNFAFIGGNLTVKKGDKVKFTNNDTALHTSTAVNGSWNSGNLSAGQSFTLDTAGLAPGTYQYRCTPHPFMTATLTVQ